MDATKHPAAGEPRLLISRAALLHNVRLLRGYLKPHVKICGIIKADAYGVGAGIVADALCNFGNNTDDAPSVDELAVATFDEAMELDDVGVPIQVLRPVENIYLGRQREQIEVAVRSGWTLTICSTSVVDDIARIAFACQRRAHVQVMVDTGMTRGGARPEDIDQIVARIESSPSLRLVGLCTHLVHGEIADHPRTTDQITTFRRFTDRIAAQDEGHIKRHVANSGGILFSPAAQFDMVRPGIGLLGIDPTGKPSIDRPLRPVIKWVAPLIDVRHVPQGTTVGYNGTWTAPRDTRIGLVPVGYADGYPRLCSGSAVTIVGDRPAPVVGRVSMDLLTIDLHDSAEAQVGDDVTLLDSDPLSPASVYALAKHAQTIPYEILCGIGRRVTRVAIDPPDAMPQRPSLSLSLSPGLKQPREWLAATPRMKLQAD